MSSRVARGRRAVGIKVAAGVHLIGGPDGGRQVEEMAEVRRSPAQRESQRQKGNANHGTDPFQGWRGVWSFSDQMSETRHPRGSLPLCQSRDKRSERRRSMDRLVIPTLETERLRLRSFRESDVDDYAALNADPEVMLHMGGPWDRGRSWRHMAFLLGHWRLAGAGMWALAQKETGAFLGVAGFAEPEGWPGLELAW